MHRNLKIALCAAAFAYTAPATAASITYSDSSVISYLPQFDPRFGVLESVMVSNVYNNAFYYTFNAPINTPAPVLSLIGTIGSRTTGQVFINQRVQTMFEADGRTVSFRLRNAVEATFTDNLSEYIGLRTIAFAAFPNINAGLNPAPVSFPSPFSQFSITYNYTPGIAPGVPEPTTWALMLAGFGMTGYALRRRRAKVAFA